MIYSFIQVRHSCYNKLAIVFKSIQVFCRLIKHVIVANFSASSLLEFFFYYASHREVYKNITMRTIEKGVLKMRQKSVI